MLAGADIVRLYGHFVPNDALNVFAMLHTVSDWLSASRALFIFDSRASLPVSELRRSRRYGMSPVFSRFIWASTNRVSKRFKKKSHDSTCRSDSELCSWYSDCKTTGRSTMNKSNWDSRQKSNDLMARSWIVPRYMVDRCATYTLMSSMLAIR